MITFSIKGLPKKKFFSSALSHYSRCRPLPLQQAAERSSYRGGRRVPSGREAHQPNAQKQHQNAPFVSLSFCSAMRVPSVSWQTIVFMHENGGCVSETRRRLLHYCIIALLHYCIGDFRTETIGAACAKENATVFECFPYVCPEPVLVKKMIISTKCCKSGVSVPVQPSTTTKPRLCSSHTSPPFSSSPLSWQCRLQLHQQVLLTISPLPTFNSRRVFCTQIKCSAAWPLAVLHIPAQEGLRNTPLFSQLSLRLTRACLGKLIEF